MRGSDEGIVEALLEAVPLVVDGWVALTMLDSCDNDVRLLVAVGLMV